MKKLRVSDELFTVLEDRAKVKGLSVADYVSSLLQPNK
jgi:hypothetical protein